MTQLADDLRAARALIDTTEKLSAMSVQDACTAVTGDITGGRAFLAIIHQDDGAPLTHEGVMSCIDRAIATAEAQS